MVVDHVRRFAASVESSTRDDQPIFRNTLDICVATVRFHRRVLALLAYLPS
jgi:hypothetical protein